MFEFLILVSSAGIAYLHLKHNPMYDLQYALWLEARNKISQ